MTRENSQRAAVNGNWFHLKNLELMFGEERLERGQGEIINVLVINGVELVFLNQIDRVREFEDDASARLEQDAESFDEIVYVGGVGENVVAEDQIRWFARGPELLSQRLTEEIDYSFDSIFAGDSGDIGGGLDAEAGDARPLKIAQEVTVVAGDFHHELFGAEGVFLDVASCGFAGMIKHRVGEGGKIEVIGKELDWRNLIGDLQHPAGGTDEQAQGKDRFGLPEIFRRQEVVGQRLQAQIQDQIFPGTTASAAIEMEEGGLLFLLIQVDGIPMHRGRLPQEAGANKGLGSFPSSSHFA
jgi:hypothetical protein